MTTFETSQSPARLDEVTVGEAMHPGVLTCPPQAPLGTVARMMASYRVHAIVVTDADPEGESDERAWGIVSDLDLARMVGAGFTDSTAGGVASTEVVTVPPEESLVRAAQMMSDHDLSHL